MQKRVNLVDLVKSFQTSVYLQNSASIQQQASQSLPRISQKFENVRISIGGNSPVDRLPAVLFLDVDGVLHPANVRFPRQQFRQDCLELLQQIVKETACAIVLSYVFSCFFDFFPLPVEA